MHGYYVELADFLGRKVPKEVSAQDFDNYVSEANSLLTRIVEWIEANLGHAAVVRFFDRSAQMGVSYANAASERHNTLLSNFSTFQKNMSRLIETDAWDRRA